MPDYKQLSKEELIHQLELKEDLLRRDEYKATRLAHDLQVHQIELEIQNRELRDKQQELETARDMYANLYDFAPVGYLTLDAKGVIRGCNLTATSLLETPRSELLDKPFNVFLKTGPEGNGSSESIGFFSALHTALDSREAQSIELKLQRKGACTDIQLLMAVNSHHGLDELLVTMQDISMSKSQRRKLNTKMHELEQMNLVMVDRELKMIELKAENQILKMKLEAIEGN